MAALSARCLETGCAGRMLPGERESGDVSVVLSTTKGALAAAVDGVGHGDEAARAARMVIEILHRNREEHVISLIELCHRLLRGTRGAAMSLAALDERKGMMTWVGVGNVEGVLISGNGAQPSETLLLRGGVVGSRLPALQAAVLPVSPRDLLVLATDGIRSGFEDCVVRGDPPEKIADCVMRQYGRATDDATVLVARYLGPRA
ncbi:MAG: SpoIIE family protein phosphatase [Candidatus Acidiferrales bacterium]